MFVFESGEVNRFDPVSIKVAVDGIFHVFQSLHMLKSKTKIKTISPRTFRAIKWVRASRSGLFHSYHALGSIVKAKEEVGEISNIFGDPITKIKAPVAGMIVGLTTNPKVYQGDAIVHIANSEK